jgi:hypothetical protein
MARQPSHWLGEILDRAAAVSSAGSDVDLRHKQLSAGDQGAASDRFGSNRAVRCRTGGWPLSAQPRHSRVNVPKAEFHPTRPFFGPVVEVRQEGIIGHSAGQVSAAAFS